MEKVGKGEGVSFTMEDTFPLRDKRKKNKKEKIMIGDKAGRKWQSQAGSQIGVASLPLQTWAWFLVIKVLGFFSECSEL